MHLGEHATKRRGTHCRKLAGSQAQRARLGALTRACRRTLGECGARAFAVCRHASVPGFCACLDSELCIAGHTVCACALPQDGARRLAADEAPPASMPHCSCRADGRSPHPQASWQAHDAPGSSVPRTAEGLPGAPLPARPSAWEHPSHARCPLMSWGTLTWPRDRGRAWGGCGLRRGRAGAPAAWWLRRRVIAPAPSLLHFEEELLRAVAADRDHRSPPTNASIFFQSRSNLQQQGKERPPGEVVPQAGDVGREGQRMQA